MRVPWAVAVVVVGLVAGTQARAEWIIEYRSGPPSPYDRLYSRAHPPGHHHHHLRRQQHRALAPVACWSEWMRVRGGYAEVRRCEPVRYSPPPGMYIVIE